MLELITLKTELCGLVNKTRGANDSGGALK